MQLRTGQGLVFCSGALCLKITEADENEDGIGTRKLEPLGMGCLHIRTRRRITLDGGRSIVAGKVLPSPGGALNEPYSPALISPPISESGGSSALPPHLPPSTPRPSTPSSLRYISLPGGSPTSRPFNPGTPPRIPALASPIKLQHGNTSGRFSSPTPSEQDEPAGRFPTLPSGRFTTPSLGHVELTTSPTTSTFTATGLRPSSYKPSAIPPPLSSVFSPSAPSTSGLSQFDPLVRVMEYYGRMGMEHPSRGNVIWKLERESPDAHTAAGCVDLQEYLAKAVTVGVVRGGSDAMWGSDWLQLTETGAAVKSSLANEPVVNMPPPATPALHSKVFISCSIFL